MKHVLAFDAATEHVAIGVASLGADGLLTPVAGIDFAARRTALTRLLPTVKELLDGADVPLSSLVAVAVGRGPGSFTGVRIAVASAKGLAHGLGVPLVGLGTLDAIAWRFAAEEVTVGVVGDAMRGEVYPCLFRCGGGTCERLGEYRVARPAVAAAQWADELDGPLLLAGNGLIKYAEQFESALGSRARMSEPGLWTPTGASVLAAAAAERDRPSLAHVLADPAHAYDNAHPAMLLPVYTRLSDAEEDEARRRPGATPATGVAGPSGGVA